MFLDALYKPMALQSRVDAVTVSGLAHWLGVSSLVKVGYRSLAWW